MDENKLTLKTLLLKYDYLESCLDEVKYKYAKYNTQFLKEYYELNPPTSQETNPVEISENTDNNDADEETKKESNDHNNDTSEDESHENTDEYSEEDKKWEEVLSKLYKKLSLKTHPDKHGGNSEIFIEMINAYQTKNALVLIKLCNKFNIEFVLTDELISYIENNISTIESTINELQHHLCWLWCNADDEAKKNFKLP